jgi:hypothetical protein
VSGFSPPAALLKQLHLQPLLPAGALVDQPLAHPHPDTQLGYLRGRDPRRRQLARQEEAEQQHAVVHAAARRLAGRASCT